MQIIALEYHLESIFIYIYIFNIHLLASFICSNSYNLLQVCKILQQSVLLASSVYLDFMPEQIIYLTVP